MQSGDLLARGMSQEQVVDTQRATESQCSIWSTMESQPIEPIVWGRLYGKNVQIKSLDLCVENFTVGRAEDNNLTLNEGNVPHKIWCRVSNKHFEISRERGDLSKPVYIQDFSRNGTFLNGEIIGKNKKRILQDDDVISIIRADCKAFVFKDLGPNNSSGIPDEICNNYFISAKLGSGACGVVRLVYNRRTCIKYAMKQVKKNILSECATITNAKNSSKVLNEALIMKELEHPCVIKMHDIVDKPDSVYMILEFMKGGDLLTRIVSKKRLSERISKLFFYQMCHAVKYLHDKGITHRDLKPDNVLLDTHDDETLLKVSDFGLSKFVNNDSVLKTLCGTPLYVAPEILLNSGRGSYTKKVDIWSLGVVLFTCLSGTLPFSEDYGTPVAEQIKKGDFSFTHSAWRSVSQVAKTLIMEMLTVNYNQRPNIDYILRHKWLKDPEVVRLGRNLMKEQMTKSAAPELNSDNENFLEPPVKRRRC